MKSKIIKLITTLTICVFGIGLIASPAYANDICSIPDIPDDIKASYGCPGAEQSADLKDVIIGILNAIIGVVAIVSIIYVVIGGITYTTSIGEAAKLEKAKKTIIYSLIGLAVCVLAFATVNWVIANMLNPKTESSEESSESSESSNSSSNSGSSSQNNSRNNNSSSQQQNN